MVDKIWYTWQQSHPANFWAYKGGSVQNLTSLQALEDWPNGMAPELHVSRLAPMTSCICICIPLHERTRMTDVHAHFLGVLSWTRGSLRAGCSRS